MPAGRTRKGEPPTQRPATVAVVALLSDGRSTGGRPIALAALNGRPLFMWSLLALRSLRAVESLTLLAPARWAARVSRELATDDRLWVRVLPIAEDRVAASLWAVGEALTDLPSTASVVCLHEVTIPVIPVDLWESALAAVDERTACATARPVYDTIKLAGEHGIIYATPSRADLRAIQTPLLVPRTALQRTLAATGHVAESAAPSAHWLTVLSSRLLGEENLRLRLIPAEPNSLPVHTTGDLSLAARWVADAPAAPG